MEENKNLEEMAMEQEAITEEETSVMNPQQDLEEMAENEEIMEPEKSSGALWMVAGAAVTAGGYVAVKWLWKKGKEGAKKLKAKLQKSKEKENPDVVDLTEEDVEIVDAEAKEGSENE